MMSKPPSNLRLFLTFRTGIITSFSPGTHPGTGTTPISLVNTVPHPGLYPPDLPFLLKRCYSCSPPVRKGMFLLLLSGRQGGSSYWF